MSPEEQPGLIERLKEDPHVQVVFVSPSGWGLKVLVSIQLDPHTSQRCRQPSPEPADMAPLLPLPWCYGTSFALTEEEAWPVLLEYNRRCRPPWSKELRHKLKDTAKEGRQPLPRGYLLGATFPHHEQAPKHHYGASKFVRVDTHEPLRGGSVDPNLHDTIPSAPPNQDQRDRESVLIGRDSAGPS